MSSSFIVIDEITNKLKTNINSNEDNTLNVQIIMQNWASRSSTESMDWGFRQSDCVGESIWYYGQLYKYDSSKKDLFLSLKTIDDVVSSQQAMNLLCNSSIMAHAISVSPYALSKIVTSSIAMEEVSNNTTLIGLMVQYKKPMSYFKNSTTAMQSIISHTIGIGKYIASLLNLNVDDYNNIEEIAESSDAIEVFSLNEEAIELLFSSAYARNVVFNSQNSMEIVCESELPFKYILEHESLYREMLTSEVAMTCISNSEFASNMLMNNDDCMNILLGSSSQALTIMCNGDASIPMYTKDENANAKLFESSYARNVMFASENSMRAICQSIYSIKSIADNLDYQRQYMSSQYRDTFAQYVIETISTNNDGKLMYSYKYSSNYGGGDVDSSKPIGDGTYEHRSTYICKAYTSGTYTQQEPDSHVIVINSYRSYTSSSSYKPTSQIISLLTGEVLFEFAKNTTASSIGCPIVVFGGLICNNAYATGYYSYSK